MISSDAIENRLCNLDKLYKESMLSSADSDLPLLYSKIAIIELGGWIEEERDDMARKLFKHLFVDITDEHYNKVFKCRISGFDYAQHFSNSIFVKLLGIHGAAEIENLVDQGYHEVFKANLGTLWKQRNECAHRSIEGTLQHIQAPSSTKNQYAHIKIGLDNLDSAIDFLRREKV